MYYTVYKTTNLINSKEYVGFHKIKNIDEIQHQESETGSIFKDGYMGSGKLIKRALEKYGPMNMKQSLLLITNDKIEAEELEKFIVNKTWVESDNNYNLSIGGGVTILYGESNGFFNKLHTKETIEKLQISRNKTLETNPFSWCEIIDLSTNEVYINHKEIYDKFNLSSRYEIYESMNNGRLKYKSVTLHNNAILNYNKRKLWLEKEPERKKKLQEECSLRFKGVMKTEKSNLKRGKSISKWIKENPKLHKERMDKINKNPEKIKKMADKHRGMKRTPEARKRMSDSQRGKPSHSKGKIFINNPITREQILIDKNSLIPEGWILGLLKK